MGLSTTDTAAGTAFRRLFVAQTISRWGDTFNSVALVILVFRLSGSGLQVAGTVAFEIAPVLLLGFVAGAVVDRHSRTGVMIAADLGRAGVAVVLAAFGHDLAVIYAAAFGLSVGTVFFNPAAASLLPSVVHPDGIVRANAALWSAAVVSQIALAPLAGALVAFAGAGPAFLINAASFLVSAALLTGLPASRPPARPPRRRLADVAEGLRIIRDSRLLGTLAGVQALAALSAGATSALLVVLAERHLHVGAAHFGLLIAAIGVGAGLGPMVLRGLVSDPRRPGLLFGPYLLRGGVDLTLAASSSFGVALASLAAYGVGTSTGMVTYNSLLQTTVPDRLRGRVFAFYDVVWQGARLVSIAGGGLLADAVGIRAVYLLGGLLLLAAGGLGLVRLRGPQLTGDGPDVRIREARPDDVAELRAVEVASGAPFAALGMEEVAADEPPAADALLARQRDGSAWVAVDDVDRPVAYLVLDVVDGCAHIDQVSVRPDRARQGIGRSLIDHAASVARARGFTALTLTTFAEVPWNAPYYERLGFRRLAPDEVTPGLRAIRRREAERGLDRWPRVCMRRDLRAGVNG